MILADLERTIVFLERAGASEESIELLVDAAHVEAARSERAFWTCLDELAERELRLLVQRYGVVPERWSAAATDPVEDFNRARRQIEEPPGPALSGSFETTVAGPAGPELWRRYGGRAKPGPEPEPHRATRPSFGDGLEPPRS